MAERQRARQVEEEKVEEVVEEKGVMELYGAMLGKIDEMSVIALKLESGPQVVALLSGLAMVRVNVNEAIEKMREEEALAESTKAYEEREEVKDE
jgi:hypothetical protein